MEELSGKLLEKFPMELLGEFKKDLLEEFPLGLAKF